MSSQNAKYKLTSKRQQDMFNRLSKKDWNAVKQLIIFGKQLEKQIKE